MRNFRFIYWALVLLAGFCHGLAGAEPEKAAAEKVRVAPEPSWVRESAVELGPGPSPDEQNGSGAYYLLLDRQVNVAASEVYCHYAKKITSETGVQNESQLQFYFDPSYQDLTIHSIRVRRGTNILNKLNIESIKIIQQERSLESYIFDGERAALALLEDIRAGDIVEYAFTTRGANPIFERKYVDRFTAQWSVFVQKNTVRLLCPKDRSIFIRNHGLDVSFTKKETGEMQEYLWDFGRSKPVFEEDQLPSWYNAYPWVQVSEFGTWADVAEWSLKLYEKPSDISTELKEQIGEWNNHFSRSEDKVLAALRFVQRQIRYLGIEVGPHSHEPHDPKTVLARRFGDCKDKSVLLCAILHELGVEAHPALISTYLSDTVRQWQPSPLAFNHVVVQARLGDKIYWLDPTLDNQRGPLEQTHFPNYRQALLVAPQSKDLIPIVPFNKAKHLRTVNETFSVSSYSEPASLQVESTYEGSQADMFRDVLASNSQQELAKGYLNYYAGMFSGVTSSAPVQVSDDEEANVIRVSESYTISELWPKDEQRKGDSKDLAYFRAHGVSGLAKKPKTSLRKMPLKIGYPLEVRHQIRIKLPEAGDFPEEHQVIEDEVQRLSYSASFQDKELKLTYEYASLRDSVATNQMPKFLANLGKMEDLVTYSIRRPAPSGGAKSLGGSINWTILMIALISLGIAFAGAVYAYRYRPVLVEALVLDPSVPAPDAKLQGIAGWLILVALAVIFSPLRIGTTFVQSLDGYSLGTWQALTQSTGVNYHPLWGPVLVMELVGNIFMLVFSILLIPLFFGRRSIFPKLYIAFLLVAAVLQIFDFWALQVLPLEEQQNKVKSFHNMTRAISSAAIWTAYMLKSRRVKLTFVK